MKIIVQKIRAWFSLMKRLMKCFVLLLNLCWQIMEEFGRCGPVAWALDSVNTVVCNYLVDSLVRKSVGLIRTLIEM